MQVEQVIRVLEQMFPKELQIAVQAIRIQELEQEIADAANATAASEAGDSSASDAD